MAWQPATFLIADFDGPSSRAGYVYRGLALHIVVKGSPKGRRPPTWALTHLGSGHRIGLIDGRVGDAFPIATDIAECGDWTFDGLNGWKNLEPELPQKLVNIAEGHKKRCRLTAGAGGSAEIARSIAMSRSP